MATKVRTWVWVSVAVAIVGILIVVALGGVAFYFLSQNIDTKAATPAQAVGEFDRVKAEFAGQKPLIELDSRGQFRRAHTDRAVPPRTAAPEHLYVLAFDPSDRRIVRFSIPFWLLRLKSGTGTIDLNGNRMDLEDLRLTVEDLERFGSALIVDHQTPGGERVIVWSR